MNNVRKNLAVLAALAGTWPLAAQTKTPSSPADEKVLELSPFEVNASNDVGYQATDTLGGTRIRTNLRDVGSAISVATKEFMRDIGATDSASLLQYMTSTEVGGVRGNFMLGSNVGDSAAINDNAARQSPQSNTRVRGLDAADNTRDFFLTDIPFDTYNVSRVDIQRGANSILFGNGSGAGIINGSTDSALLGQNSTSVNVRYGSYGSYRGSININRDLIPNELAIRIALLKNQTYYEQEPAFNQDDRQYAALRWEPKFLKKGSARTTFKVSYENGNITANRPRVNTINDAITPWFLTAPKELRSPTPLGRAAGQDDTLLGVMMPMISHAGYDPFVTGIANASLDPSRKDIGARATFNATTNPNAEGWLGAFVKTNDQGGAQIGPGIDVSNGGNTFWIAEYDNPSSSDLGRYLYPAYGNVMYNTVAANGLRSGATPSALRAPDMTGLLRLDQYSFRGDGSFLYTLQGVWRSNTITDPSIFNFYKNLIDGPNKGEGSKFKAFNASVDQTFWDDRLGFQLAVDQQEYSDYRYGNLNNPTLTIDMYRYLPVANYNAGTGLFEPVVNPNFGRPYVISQTTGNNRRTFKKDTVRFTPYADLNFPDLLKTDNVLAKVLGRHTITGLLDHYQSENFSTNWTRYSVDANQAASIFGPNRTITGAERAVAVISYLGPDIHSLPTLSGVNLSPITALQQPQTYLTNSGNTIANNAYYFNSNWTGAALPAGSSVAYTPPALGLAPNQVGGAATTQSNNPANYGAWSGTPRQLSVTTADFGNERELSTSASQTKSKITSKALVDQWALLDRSVVVTAGVRKDKIDTYTPGNPQLAADSPARTGQRLVPNTTGAVDWDAPFDYPGSPSSSYESSWLKTYGVVLHSPKFINKHLPWGMEFSLFYNKSENFRPETRRDPINGSTLTPPTGDTKDYGIMVSALDGRVSLKVNRYETKVQNATLQDNSVLNFIRDEVTRGIQFSKSVIYINDINHGTNVSGGNPGLVVGTPGSAGNSSYAYRASSQPQNPDSNNGDLDPGNTHWYPWQPARAATAAQPWTLAEWQAEETHALAAANAFLSSLASPEAVQFMTANNINPNNWDYHLGNNNISSQAPANVQVTGDTVSKGTEYELFLRPLPNWNVSINAAKTFATRLNLAGNVADWLATRWDLYNLPDPNYPGGLLAGDVRWFGGGQGNVSSGNARFGRNGYKFFSEFHAREGVNVAELRPWRFNVVSNYNFTRSRLKGVFVGGAYRWEDKSVVGYGVTETDHEVIRQVGTQTVSVRAAIGKLDTNKPFYGPEEKHLDLWVGYQRKIWKGMDWRIQLNVYNVGENDHLVPISVNPDGSTAAARIATGMEWYVSNSIKF